MVWKTKALAVVLFSVALTGCASVNFKELSTQGPDFNFIEYFEGHTRASGWFADRFGNIKRNFCGDFIGTQTDAGFSLDETLYYTDGVVEKRVWIVDIKPDGVFNAESEALVGSATGIQKGSGLQLEYKMNVLISEDNSVLFKMNDYMFYQPDGSLHNSTEVNKWGVRLGNVSTQYYKHDGSASCMATKETASAPFRRYSSAS